MDNPLPPKGPKHRKKRCFWRGLQSTGSASEVGRRQGRERTSGRWPRSPCPCRRPSLVTEGYTVGAATPTSDAPPSHSRSAEAYVIYVVFCLQCQKKSVFTVFRALRRQGIIHLGDARKPRFSRGFALQEGARGGQIGILRSFQHRWPKHGPNIAPKMAQHGPTWAQHRQANIGPT